jgi:hypothetical protein
MYEWAEKALLVAQLSLCVFVACIGLYGSIITIDLVSATEAPEAIAPQRQQQEYDAVLS